MDGAGSVQVPAVPQTSPAAQSAVAAQALPRRARQNPAEQVSAARHWESPVQWPASGSRQVPDSQLSPDRHWFAVWHGPPALLSATLAPNSWPALVLEALK